MPGNSVVSEEVVLNFFFCFLLLQKFVEIVQVVFGPSEIGAIITVQMLRAVSSGDETLKGCLEGCCSLVRDNLQVYCFVGHAYKMQM